MACPVCRGSRVKGYGTAVSVYSGNPQELAVCDDCSHRWLLNPPSPEDLDALYGTTYNYESHQAIEDEKRWRFGKLGRHVGRMIPRDAGIIDVGCGFGESLKSLRALGYSRLFGIERSPLAVEKCREDGLDVFQGTFDEWIAGQKDRSGRGGTCVILSHVIEHVQNPGEFLDAIAGHLEAGDCLMVMVPNAKARTVKFLGRYWGWWQVPVHLHHFTRESMLRLLSSKGFTAEPVLSRGADSLFFLSCAASLLRIRSRSRRISGLQRLIIRACSVIFRYWLFIGNEELVIAARKNQGPPTGE